MLPSSIKHKTEGNYQGKQEEQGPQMVRNGQKEPRKEKG
jgi:hypothetical protein